MQPFTFHSAILPDPLEDQVQDVDVPDGRGVEGGLGLGLQLSRRALVKQSYRELAVPHLIVEY